MHRDSTAIHSPPSLAIIVSLFLLAVSSTLAHASVTLFMEEPFGEFGAFNPTGHAAIYLDHVCADTPERLRPCNPGELGVVLSRYHHIADRDWIAVPLIPYLYAVEDLNQIPSSASRAQVDQLRAAYWKDHLEPLAPPTPDGELPSGEWTQLIGSSYDREIRAFELDSTPEEDARLIALLNDRRNIAHFNLFFHNCADFSRTLLDLYYPHSIHRNFIADFGLTTPKQVAHSVAVYGKAHPTLHLTTFTIPQIPGDLPRSHSIDGIAESLLKSKKYLVPLAVLHPEFTGALFLGYLATGRPHMPAPDTVFKVEDLQAQAAIYQPIESSN